MRCVGAREGVGIRVGVDVGEGVLVGRGVGVNVGVSEGDKIGRFDGKRHAKEIAPRIIMAQNSLKKEGSFFIFRAITS